MGKRQKGVANHANQNLPACLLEVPPHPWFNEEMYDNNHIPWQYDPNIGMIACPPVHGAGDGAFCYAAAKGKLSVVPNRNSSQSQRDEKRIQRRIEAFLQVMSANREQQQARRSDSVGSVKKSCMRKCYAYS